MSQILLFSNSQKKKQRHRKVKYIGQIHTADIIFFPKELLKMYCVILGLQQLKKTIVGFYLSYRYLMM